MHKFTYHLILFITFTTVITFADRNIKFDDSTRVTLINLTPKYNSLIQQQEIQDYYDYTLFVHSIKYGQTDVTLNILVHENIIEYLDDSTKSRKIITGDSILLKKIAILINLISEYKTEYTYKKCSQAFDGYGYKIELQNNLKHLRCTIESGDFDYCYENLCLIFGKIAEIEILILGKEIGSIIPKVRKDPIPCFKIPEILKSEFK